MFDIEQGVAISIFVRRKGLEKRGIAHADLWLHGHVHCCHDYHVARAQGSPTRVVCNARGLADKDEGLGFDPLRVIEI